MRSHFDSSSRGRKTLADQQANFENELARRDTLLQQLHGQLRVLGAAAAQSPQTAPPQPMQVLPGVVDLRLLGKPDHFELVYVDWAAAVALLYNMTADEIPWDIPALVECAVLSARRVRGELREMRPDEQGEPLGETHPGEHGGFEGTLARSALSLDNEVP